MKVRFICYGLILGLLIFALVGCGDEPSTPEEVLQEYRDKYGSDRDAWPAGVYEQFTQDMEEAK